MDWWVFTGCSAAIGAVWSVLWYCQAATTKPKPEASENPADAIFRRWKESEAAKSAKQALLEAVLEEARKLDAENRCAYEEREWRRLRHCPICHRPSQSVTYAHVGPDDTHAEQIRKCVSGHTWSRKMRLESIADVAPVPPCMPIEETAKS